MVHDPQYDYPIGTTYKTRGKHPRLCTVVNIWHTYNADGDHVRTRYVTTHEGPFKQILTDHDVVRTTIDMGLVTVGTYKSVGA